MGVGDFVDSFLGPCVSKFGVPQTGCEVAVAGTEIRPWLLIGLVVVAFTSSLLLKFIMLNSVRRSRFWELLDDQGRLSISKWLGLTGAGAGIILMVAGYSFVSPLFLAIAGVLCTILLAFFWKFLRNLKAALDLARRGALEAGQPLRGPDGTGVVIGLAASSISLEASDGSLLDLPYRLAEFEGISLGIDGQI